jgi:hypothetical protein
MISAALAAESDNRFHPLPRLFYLALMRRTRTNRKIFLALCANGIILLLLLLAVISRDNPLNIGSPAFANRVTVPDAIDTIGGPSLHVMPAQLSPNTWGCYLLDDQNLTLSVYQYSPGDKLLRFAAARNIMNDRLLKDFNTLPPPAEVKELVNREREAAKENPSTQKSQ